VRHFVNSVSLTNLEIQILSQQISHNFFWDEVEAKFLVSKMECSNMSQSSRLANHFNQLTIREIIQGGIQAVASVRKTRVKSVCESTPHHVREVFFAGDDTAFFVTSYAYKQGLLSNFLPIFSSR
jgi:hypothetical protein